MQIEEIERLIALVGGSHVRELTLKNGAARVTIRKPAPLGELVTEYETEEPADSAVPAVSVAAFEDTSGAPASSDSFAVTSPLVGFYHHGKAVVGVGATVKAGQVVGVIESMKLINEVRCPEAGTVKEALIEEGMPVEYGQALFIIERTA